MLQKDIIHYIIYSSFKLLIGAFVFWEGSSISKFIMLSVTRSGNGKEKQL